MIIKDTITSLGIQIVKDAGKELYCLCPFHEDSKQSFNVNSLTGAWQCWTGCGRGKDIYSLVAKCLNITYAEAKLEIDKGFSIKLWSENFRKNLTFEQEKPQDIVTDLFFLRELPLAIDNAGGEYLKSRGFLEKTIRFWGILHSDKKAGIIIPIRDFQNSLVGYLFRSIKGKDMRFSYGFKSSSYLFGSNILNKNNSKVNVVEGCLDCIWMWQNGFENTLSSFTCSLSDEQLSLLLGFAREVNIIYDSDVPGYRGAKEVSKKIDSLLLNKVVILPNGRDPCDCSKEEIMLAVEQAKYSFLEGG